MQILKENGTLENHFGGCKRSDWDAAPFYDDQRQTRVEKNISKAILTKKDPSSDLVDENLITQGRIDC